METLLIEPGAAGCEAQRYLCALWPPPPFVIQVCCSCHNHGKDLIDRDDRKVGALYEWNVDHAADDDNRRIFYNNSRVVTPDDDSQERTAINALLSYHEH